MQYKSVVAALLLGLCVTGEAAAQQGGRGGNQRGQGGKEVGGNNAQGGANNDQGGAAGNATVAAAANDGKNGGQKGGQDANQQGANNAGGNNDANQGGNNAQGGNANLELDPELVQKGSEADGQDGAAAGQAPSETDNANFINFCKGKKTLTNGLQVKGGSCNGIRTCFAPSPYL